MGATSARRIVMGFDGSYASIAALHWAAIEANSTGSTLELVMAWQWPVNCGWPQALTDSYNPEASAREELETAEKRAREMHPGVDIRTRLVQGQPASALVEASWGAALLVVGSGQRHGRFWRFLFGSVRNRCVANAHCPVVVFHFGERRTRQPATPRRDELLNRHLP
jgi:nucleotide-binding universal stress UspA family protein